MIILTLQNFNDDDDDTVDPDIPFPETYPSGCLLGCVDVVDCLSQEEYLQQVCFTCISL